ncbi:MAG: hypothetical protein RMJ60_08555 [Anaerolineales bacterium]|nr:hypothetical protein [Anaerolineales bacterium]
MVYGLLSTVNFNTSKSHCRALVHRQVGVAHPDAPVHGLGVARAAVPWPVAVTFLWLDIAHVLPDAANHVVETVRRGIFEGLKTIAPLAVVKGNRRGQRTLGGHVIGAGRAGGEVGMLTDDFITPRERDGRLRTRSGFLPFSSSVSSCQP